MSAPLSPEIRALLARCMSQIELEWGKPDAELRAVLGVPFDAPIGTKPSEPAPVLLPCPFCGTSKRDDSDPYATDVLFLAASEDVYRVHCHGCWAVAACADTREGAIAAWNRRHPGDAPRSGEATSPVLGMIDGSAGLGVGLRAYPNELDRGQRLLWMECLRLEAAGKVKRADVSTADCVLFVPAEPDAPPTDGGSMLRCPDCDWISLSPRVAAHHREVSGHGEARAEALDEEAYLRQDAADRRAHEAGGGL